MGRRVPRPRPEMGTAGEGPADTATVVNGIDGSSASWAAFCWARGEARRPGGRAVAVFASPADVPPHREAPNLPGGVSDETNPGGSPRSHR